MALRPTPESVAGIVLAAGQSRRMGRFKQLLPAAGERVLVEVVVDQVRAVLDQVIVVVGHRGAEVRARLAGRDVAVVENGAHREGMLSSVQCGVAAAPAAAAGFLICLGDQPRVPQGLIAAILAAAARSGCGIALPVWEGRGGHPVYLAATYRDEILALTGAEGGLRAVTRGHPEDTVEVAASSAAVVDDLDTPEQYRQYRADEVDGHRPKRPDLPSARGRAGPPQPPEAAPG